MAIRIRPTSTTDKQQSLDLLQALIETPPAPREARLRPVALRSVSEQRRYALSGYRLRTWVDGLLRYVEWLLLMVAVIVFGAWFVDGPVRDWLHERQAPAAAAPAPARPAAPIVAAAPAGESDRSVLLPYTTPDMAAPAQENDFMAPRQGVVAAPAAIAPQPTRLLIPAIDLDTPVKEVFIVDGAWEVADYAAGYLHETGLPGEAGNAVLAGHAGLRGAVFRDLSRLMAGADVYVDAAGWRYHYRVRSAQNVWPTQVEVLDPTDTPVLTLLTCTNWDTQRLVVVADLIDSKPTPTP